MLCVRQQVLFLGATLFITGLLSLPAVAESAGAGRNIALESCASCHDVAPRKLRENEDYSKPPSFAWIAKRNPGYLDGVALRAPYGMMHISLTPGMLKDLKAYLATFP